MVTLRATASWEFRTALSFLVISEYILRKTFVVLLLLYKVVFTVVLHAISTMVTGTAPIPRLSYTNNGKRLSVSL